MIKGFKHKGLRKFYEKGSKAGITTVHENRLRDILGSLDAAIVVEDMDASGYNLHPLKGKLKEHWAVSVGGAWRVTFSFDSGDAYMVDYQQYH